MIVNTNYVERYNFEDDNMSIGFQKTFVPIPSSNIIFDKCTWCGEDLGEWFYRCLICNFSLDLHCAKKDPPLTIQNPKNHHHSLSFFPRPLSFPCNACGLINVLEPGYACYQCNYVVHQHCTDLPRVLKITRHPHRLSQTPYLPTKVYSCRVCYKNVDIKYGQYSCNRGDQCSYVVHSTCATHKEVWGGEELEWEPEESDETEDIAAYKKVGPGLIEHFSHRQHNLKLDKCEGARDSGKQCQACMRSITSHDFYNCVECDYFLHEVCANLPRLMDHALHKHSLLLDPYPPLITRELGCVVCYRRSSGWRYICERCNSSSDKQFSFDDKQFHVDVNCILVPECFTHESHTEHRLFTTVSFSGVILCRGCKKSTDGCRLQCTICEFTICYRCATIPNEIYYKYEEYPLSLCYGESSVDGMYWCEVCEKRLDPTEWFYTNKKGCTTIHHKCLLGDSAYMKAGQTFNHYNTGKVEVVRNSSSRPTCHECQNRCPHPVYFETCTLAGTFCSFYCL